VFYFTGIEKCDRENGNGFLKKWQVFPGMGGRYIPECPAGISRNQWQVTAGICNKTIKFKITNVNLIGTNITIDGLLLDIY